MLHKSLSDNNQHIKTIYFYWDGVLSDYLDTGFAWQKFAFPVETLHVLSELKKRGIEVKIVTVYTDTQYITRILKGDIAKYISEKDVIFNANLISTLEKETEKSPQILLVNADKYDCEIAKKKGFTVIEVENKRDLLRVSNADHLFLAAEKCGITQCQDNFSISIINRAINGIQQYQKNGTAHLSFFAKLFDATRGQRRADIYLNLLRDNTKSLLQKKIILYSLLASVDGKTLQKNVYEAMGFSDLDTARSCIDNDINRDLKKSSNENNFSDAIDKVNKTVIAKLVNYANSNNIYQVNECNNILNKFKC
ncbi:MAG: hypothetical protein ACD_29C00478G0005 [uncultured bacterium]|nr:MAG: hypothetical protein ACD_29C00478G0005 [uncultured bacterium]